MKNFFYYYIPGGRGISTRVFFAFSIKKFLKVLSPRKGGNCKEPRLSVPVRLDLKHLFNCYTYHVVLLLQQITYIGHG